MVSVFPSDKHQQFQEGIDGRGSSSVLLTAMFLKSCNPCRLSRLICYLFPFLIWPCLLQTFSRYRLTHVCLEQGQTPGKILICLAQPSDFQHTADTLISSGFSLSSMSGMQRLNRSVLIKKETEKSKIFNDLH